MEITRRDFIKKTAVLGTSLLVPPVSLYAQQKKRERWHPAYEALDAEGKLAERIEQAY